MEEMNQLEAEEAEAEIKKCFDEGWRLLDEFVARKGYRALGYGNAGDWAKERLGISRRAVELRVQQARVSKALEGYGFKFDKPIPQAQAARIEAAGGVEKALEALPNQIAGQGGMSQEVALSLMNSALIKREEAAKRQKKGRMLVPDQVDWAVEMLEIAVRKESAVVALEVLRQLVLWVDGGDQLPKKLVREIERIAEPAHQRFGEMSSKEVEEEKIEVPDHLPDDWLV